MRLPLAREIAVARAAFEESREAAPFVARLEHALTATHVVMSGATRRGRPGADLLATLHTRWPQIGLGGDTLEDHEAALQGAHALLVGLVAELPLRNAALGTFLHDQSHLAMDPMFDDVLVELAELDERHKAIEAQIQDPVNRLSWLGSAIGVLQVVIELAGALERPAEDPIGAVAYRAGTLANSYAIAAETGLRNLDLAVQLPPPPEAPERVDPADADRHWAALAEVQQGLRGVLAAIEADRDLLQPTVTALATEQRSIERKIFEHTG